MQSELAAAPFITTFLLLLTIPHHWKRRNFPTLSIIAWLTVHGIIQGVNAVLWADNVRSQGLPAKIWCDIGTKLSLGAEVGLPGCCLCLARHLYLIVSGGYVQRGPGTRWRWTVDIWLCWAMPILVMGLHIIVQGHRFDIIESIGCVPAIYFSWPAVILLNLSVFLSGLLSPVYSVCTLWKLFKQQRVARARIQTHSTGRSGSRTSRNPSSTSTSRMSYALFIRLLAVTLLVGTGTTAFTAVAAYGGFKSGLKPWISWAFVHDGFGAIGHFPLRHMTGTEKFDLYLMWWPWSVGSLVFCLFFGIGREAREEWAELWWAVAAKLGWQRRRKERTVVIVSSLDSTKNSFLVDLEAGSRRHDSFGSLEDDAENKSDTDYGSTVEHINSPTSPTKPLEVLVTVTVERPNIRPLPFIPGTGRRF